MSRENVNFPIAYARYIAHFDAHSEAHFEAQSLLIKSFTELLLLASYR